MSELSGHRIVNSAEIQKHIQELVRLVEESNASITGPRPPMTERAQENAGLIEQIGKTRGRPLYFQYVGSGSGHGPYVELEDGSVKLDLVNGIGINLMGHSHPNLIAAGIRGSIQDVVVQGNLQPNKEYLRLGQKLIQMAGKGTRLKHAWLSTCGTIANENALKMARQKKSPARKIIALKDAFAGRSTMMAEVTDNPAYKEGLPKYEDVLRVSYFNRKDPRSTENTLKQLKEHVANHPNDISVFTFEPLQGEGGYRVAPREFYLPILGFCREHKIPVWADEVQTFTRTGELLAMQTLELGDYVDVVTIAKTLQLAATLYTEEFNPKPGLVAGTFAGTTSAIYAGIETLRMLDEENYFGSSGKISKIHNEFVATLNNLSQGSCKGKISEVEGLGLMVGMTPFDGSKAKVEELIKTFFKNGLMTYSCGHDPYRIRFLIPAVMTSKDIQVAGQIIEKSILEISK